MRVKIINETAQEFDGVRYWLCGEYFQNNGARLHRVVWKKHNGKIEKGKCIHHKDHNKQNNQIENLELRDSIKHNSYHGKLNDTTNWQTAMKEGAKKWHKSEEGRSWHKKHFEEIKHKILKEMFFKCVVCGNEFSSSQINSKFCSNVCRSQNRRKSGVDDVTKNCIVCGKEFTKNKYYKTQTCSRKCGAKIRR